MHSATLVAINISVCTNIIKKFRGKLRDRSGRYLSVDVYGARQTYFITLFVHQRAMTSFFFNCKMSHSGLISVCKKQIEWILKKI